MGTKRIAFVIDGYYGFTLYKDIKSKYEKEINFEDLVNSVCDSLGCIINEKCISPANLRLYYMGTDSKKSNPERNEYENSLMSSRFGARGRPLRYGKEKGIDTMLYSDIIEEARSGVFDYLVLFAGDLDHITLVEDLNNLGIKTILLYGEIIKDGIRTTGCSKELRNSCFKSIDLYKLLEDKEIFYSLHEQTNSMLDGTTKPKSARNIECGPSLLQRVISSVLQVIFEKEQLEGEKQSFAIQAQVGTQLKKDGVTLPIPLGVYFRSYPNIFKTGKHPLTHASTVSVL